MKYYQMTHANGPRTCKKCQNTIATGDQCITKHDAEKIEIENYYHLFCSDMFLDRFLNESMNLLEKNYQEIINTIKNNFNKEKKIISKHSKEKRKLEVERSKIKNQIREIERTKQEQKNKMALLKYLENNKKNNIQKLIKEEKTPKSINDICNEMYERGELNYD